MRNVKVLQGTVLLLFCCVLLLVFALLSTPAKTPSPGQSDMLNPDDGDPNAMDAIVATIGGHQITERQLQGNLQSSYGRQMLNQILDRTATALRAAELGIQVTDDEIERELGRMQQGYDDEQQFYDAMLEQLDLTKQQLREDVYYRLLVEKIAVHSIRISDRQVSDYIAEHPEEFTSHIQLRIFQIIVQTKETANQIIHLLEQGGDFEQLAMEYSIDEFTAADGGDLGWIDLDDPFVPEPIMDVAAGLDENEVSSVIAVDDGYAVIKLVQRKQITRDEEQDIRENVRKDLALAEAPPIHEIIAQLRIKYKAKIVDSAYQGKLDK